MRKPELAMLTTVFFCLPVLQTSLPPQKKICLSVDKQAYLVDKVTEISNLDLVKDLAEVVDSLTISE